jgi:hypothetical protein
MATVSRQIVPPSLLAAYGAVLTAPGDYAGLTPRIGLKAKTRQAQIPPAPDPVLQLRREAARWLVQQWQPDNPGLFYVERLAEIRSYDFKPPYWHRVTPSRDRTEYGEPAIKACERPVNSLYADPLRLQTDCVYSTWSKTYPTPADEGTVLQPAPGWQGQVVGGVWRDLWFAQRRLTFFLPVIVNKTDTRPVLIVLASQVTAVASFRVNNAWYARGCWPYFFTETLGEIEPVNYLMSNWQKTDVYPMALVSETEHNWQCTHTLQVLRNPRLGDTFKQPINCNRLGVVITTPPSRGVYFARNDAVKVTHHETVTVYLGKEPS